MAAIARLRGGLIIRRWALTCPLLYGLTGMSSATHAVPAGAGTQAASQAVSRLARSGNRADACVGGGDDARAIDERVSTLR